MTRAFRYPYRYPLRALGPDYAGAVAGVALSFGLLGFVELALPIAWVAAAAGALFLVYFARTVCRQLTEIELDESGIRVRGPAVPRPGASIRWAELCLLRLDYYSTRRDSEGGWMQLKLGDAQRTIRIDSDLDGFAELVGAAAQAAARRDLAIDASTLSNLEAMRR